VAGRLSVVEELHVGKVDMLWEVAEGSLRGIVDFGNIQLVRTGFHIADLGFAESVAVVVLAVPEKGRLDSGRWRGWWDKHDRCTRDARC